VLPSPTIALEKEREMRNQIAALTNLVPMRIMALSYPARRTSTNNDDLSLWHGGLNGDGRCAIVSRLHEGWSCWGHLVVWALNENR